MYRFFQHNYSNYIDLNAGSKDYRSTIAKPLELLFDLGKYNIHRHLRDDLFRETNNLIYHMSKKEDHYSRFETFGFDLFLLGYEACQYEEFSDEQVEEQLKLIDLLLGFSYTF